MGFDLRRNNNDILSVSLWTWPRAYAFAIEGGWEPRGTLPPKSLSKARKMAWSGAYDSSDGQIITDEDARAMADTLEKMRNSLGPSVAESAITQGVDVSLSCGYDQPRDYFRPENKRKVLQALIEFLRGGACEIW